MNQLQIKSIKKEPAQIEFNKEQVIKELKGMLAKYENLVFTEDNTAEIRSTLAELRKGKRAADEYRKEIKKELTAPVTKFEAEIKEITAMFDEVINPINEQLKAYDERLREDKRKLYEEHIEKVVEDVGLERKYALQIEIKDGWLNKSSPVKQIKETIEFIANNLLTEQQLDIANRENIESYVKLKNETHDVNLSVVSYLSQLELSDVDEVKKTIDNHVEMELKEIARKEQKKMEYEKKVIKEAEEIVQEHEEKSDNPFVNLDNPFNEKSDNSVLVTRKYIVKGTVDQLQSLEYVMDETVNCSVEK